jgi:guanylate kinase
MPPSVAELEKRLLARGTDEKSKIKVRVKKAIEEMKLADYFDYICVNENLDTAQNEVLAIVMNFLNE